MRKLRIPEGPIVRSHKQQRAYNKVLRHAKATNAACQFCVITPNTPENSEVVQEYPLFWVVTAKYPYHVWDGSRVGEHLLLVPKRHVDSISHFTTPERHAYADIVAEWEIKGFSIYARAPQSKQKSIPHQHSHFIEVGTRIKGQLFVHKPFINIAH